MDFLKDILDNSILVIPNNLKKKILDYIDSNNLLINTKILTFNEIKRSLLDYSSETIYYVMNKYDVKYSIAKDYLNSLYYLEDIDDDKIRFLKELKDDLDKQDLLIYDDLFIPLVSSKSKLYIYGFSYIDKYNKSIIDMMSNYIDIEYIDITHKNIPHDVLKFNTINDEITYVCEEISKLLNKGISIDKIHLVNYQEDYYFTIKRIFKEYNIPISLKSDTTLYKTSIGTYFINNLSDNIDKLLFKIRTKFDTSNHDNEIVYNKLSDMINTYYWTTSITSVKDLIIEDMKHIKIPTSHFDKEIKISDIINNVIDDDEYVFFIGFSNAFVPKVKQDTDYLNDHVKLNNKNTTLEINKMIKYATLVAIKDTLNLCITCASSSPFNSYEVSYLINDEALTLKEETFNYSVYSDNINKLNLSLKIDNLIKFNQSDDNLSLLSSNYDIPYKVYDNKFTGIDNHELINKINDKMVFSYSNISKYYDCPFKFYVSDVLRVSSYEKTLDQFIGSLFHFVLEKCVDSNEDIDTTYKEYVDSHIDELDKTYKNDFFIKILKEEISFVVLKLKEQKSKSLVNDIWMEKKIEIDVDRKIKAKIKGFVDKVMFVGNSAIIVDYKTNNSELNKDLFKYGITIQLPIYLYLLKCLDSNIEVAGFYLQHILDLNIKHDKDKSYLDTLSNNLKLTGITFNNIDNVIKFDNTYEASTVIDGVRLDNKTGMLKQTKKVMDEAERDELANLMESLIYRCIDNVSDGMFDITPIKIEKEHDGCEYCEYRDICYKRMSNYNIINLKLEGDDNNE